MAQTLSTMLPLGTRAPSFVLPDASSGEMLRLAELQSETGTVIMFICNHCPYVKHVRDELVRVANDYQPRGVAFIAISSNDVVAYPEDAPEHMKTFAREAGFTFPYLFDESQEVARAYQAACTPDFYIFDRAMKCVYRGRLDDSRPKNDTPVTGKDLRAALDAIIAGKPVSAEQHPSLGCNIKWKP